MTTAYQVDLVFGTAKADSQLARMEQKLRGINQKATGAGGQNAFGGISKGAAQADAKLTALLGTIGGVGAALAAAGAGWRFMLQAAQDAETAQVRLRSLARGYDDLASVQRTARENARLFNISQADSASQLAQVYGLLRPLGLTLKEVNDVYIGFNTATRNAGASAA